MRITQTARRIHGSNLDETVAQSGSGDELDQLAATLNDMLRRIGDTLPEKIVGVLKTSCAASENRQLFDLTAQTMGRQRRFDDSIDFFERALEKDPNAINSRLGLVITLRFARRAKDAKAHVRWLLDVIPEERSIHPIALHIGKVSKDQALIDEALALIEKHAPNQLEAAKNFLKSPVR